MVKKNKKLVRHFMVKKWLKTKNKLVRHFLFLTISSFQSMHNNTERASAKNIYKIDD